MAGENDKSFWTTLPGILTGIATVLTAITGILIFLNSIGYFSPPTIDLFAASPEEVVSGGSTSLNWSVSRATNVYITGIGPVSSRGLRTVHPTESTTYKLTASNRWASVDATTFVDVNKAILSTPKQLSPYDGEIFDHYPRETNLTWTTVPGSTSYMVEIEFYSPGSPGSWVPFIKTKVTTTSYTFSFVGAQPGRWRVWAVDSMGNESEKSGWWEFRYTR